MAADPERRRHQLTDLIVKAVRSGDLDEVDRLAEMLVEMGYKEGADSLLIDLWDSEEIGEEAVEFAIENNGVGDPRPLCSRPSTAPTGALAETPEPTPTRRTLMSELEPVPTTGAIAATGAVLETVVNYGIVITQLTAAGIRLRGLSQHVRGTYRYVEGCSESVDRLAEQMASLEVDGDTINEHREAAAVMRSVLAEAEAMAEATEDLATLFGQASEAHQADYGLVADAATHMPVPMADAQFYSNR
ncbi:hypothetical protein ACIBEJ_34210 [Nonomuraea sp. NPDC050790]|uniref:hypothetical protein n=1 Tax=Nonomuraea sp. NPDC050790 TaxID=3364371 RepID=UPI0037A37708